jgi:hypothetical protein
MPPSSYITLARQGHEKANPLKQTKLITNETNLFT